jgi:hypothetical protein
MRPGYVVTTGLSLLALALVGCGGGGGQSSTGGLDFGCSVDADGRDTCTCYDTAHLEVGTFRSKLTPADHPGAATYRRHVSAGACEAYEFCWIDEPGQFYWQELVTNCAPESRGGPAAKSGFPASCLLDVGGGGGEDGYPRTVSYAMGCVCCANGVCGHYCHDIPNVTCADYSYDFIDPSIGDPRDHPDICDCTVEP